jgi:hypothetical protein
VSTTLKKRIAPLAVATVVIGAVIAVAMGMASASTKTSSGKSADPVVIGMPYYLYQGNANIAGPCGNNSFIRTAGVVNLPNRYYETKKLFNRFDGSVTEREFYDYRGFSSAYRYLYCKDHKYVYRYYGKTKVHREKVCTNHVNEGGWVRIGCSYTTGWKKGWKNP